MVGTINASLQIQSELREYVQLIGPVPRTEIRKHFEWADTFLLPSLCEGSATVTYEALGYGLPLVCTANTGSVVRDGVDGFIVATGEVDPVVERLESLCANQARLIDMSHQARARAEEFTVERYGQRLLAALSSAPSQKAAYQ
jgi:glycosyltransferase involved in cell wall biosynthesis